jgi:hypothetical protein
LLLDIFFDYFKAIPKQTHRIEKIKLQINSGLLVQYTINTTLIEAKTATQNQTATTNQTAESNKTLQELNTTIAEVVNTTNSTDP